MAKEKENKNLSTTTLSFSISLSLLFFILVFFMTFSTYSIQYSRLNSFFSVFHFTPCDVSKITLSTHLILIVSQDALSPYQRVWRCFLYSTAGLLIVKFELNVLMRSSLNNVAWSVKKIACLPSHHRPFFLARTVKHSVSVRLAKFLFKTFVVRKIASDGKSPDAERPLFEMQAMAWR